MTRFNHQQLNIQEISTTAPLKGIPPMLIQGVAQILRDYPDQKYLGINFANCEITICRLPTRADAADQSEHTIPQEQP